MSGTRARHIRKVRLTFTLITRFQVSTSILSKLPICRVEKISALFTSPITAISQSLSSAANAVTAVSSEM